MRGYAICKKIFEGDDYCGCTRIKFLLSNWNFFLYAILCSIHQHEISWDFWHFQALLLLTCTIPTLIWHMCLSKNPMIIFWKYQKKFYFVWTWVKALSVFITCSAHYLCTANGLWIASLDKTVVCDETEYLEMLAVPWRCWTQDAHAHFQFHRGELIASLVRNVKYVCVL